MNGHRWPDEIDEIAKMLEENTSLKDRIIQLEESLKREVYINITNEAEILRLKWLVREMGERCQESIDNPIEEILSRPEVREIMGGE